MLERLVAFALSQRLFVAFGVLLLIGAGLVMLPSLPIDAFPDVSPVQVKVIMKAPGLTPEEVEQRITVPIELELLGLPNKKILRSTTKYALADVTVDFEDGTDIYWARNQVSERLSNICRDLPGGSERRTGSNHEPTRRNVHVHHRQSGSVARRATQPA